MTSWDSIRFTQTKTQQTFSPNTSQQKHSTDTCRQLGSTPSTTSTREWIQQQQFHNTRAANALCARVHNCVSKQCTHRHTHTRTRLSHDRCHQQTLMNISLVSFHPVFQQDLFWNPNMVIYFDYQHQHHWLSQHDFLFCRMTYFNKILPNVKVNMSCDAWWCQHRLLTTVVYSTFFLCSHFCVNRTAHSTVVGTQQGTRVPRHLQHAQLVKQLHLELQHSCDFGNSWRWDPTTSHLYASTSHSVRWHSTTGILARGSKDQNQDDPQQVASSPWRRTTIPILWCEDTREVEGIFNTGIMADGAINRWAPPTALRWSEQVSWANRHGRQHGRERRRVINNDHNRDGAQTTSRCRSTKTTEPCATWRSTHESLKCA